MEIRDPVHGFIEIEDGSNCERIVNHPVFQRLRGLSQLALAHYAYPGARHSRFEHSLGVYHLAGRIADQVGLKAEEKRHVQLAALVHDLGHAPFSHVLEPAISRLSGITSEEESLHKLHERVTLDICSRVLLEEKVINEAELEAVTNILDLRNIKFESVQRQIVSSELDADMLDYLLRDSYYCGVRYGLFDLERLLRGTRKYPDGETVAYLAVAAEDIEALEQCLVAKNVYYRTVVEHRIRRITDAMIGRAVLEAAKCNMELCEQFAYKDNPKDEWYTGYLGWDDARLLRALCDTSGVAGNLGNRLRERRLLKEVFSAPSDACATLQERFGWPLREPEDSATVEREVANICSVQEPSLVIFESRSPRSPWRGRDASVATEDKQRLYVLVNQHPPEVRPLEEISQFFSHGELTGREMVYVYAPVDEPNRQRRQHRVTEWAKKIGDFLGYDPSRRWSHRRPNDTQSDVREGQQ